jgi:antitoxin (DNA-binding transcriptional repressor) of toxin-antitoxin stability system
MKFISVRDLRNTPSEVWNALDEGDDLVLTASGRPKAIVVRVTDEDLGSTMEVLRRARAQLALSRLRGSAKAKGSDQLSDDDVDLEIKAARRERRTA